MPRPLTVSYSQRPWPSEECRHPAPDDSKLYIVESGRSIKPWVLQIKMVKGVKPIILHLSTRKKAVVERRCIMTTHPRFTGEQASGSRTFTIQEIQACTCAPRCAFRVQALITV